MQLQILSQLMSASDQKYTELPILGRGNVYIQALKNLRLDLQLAVKPRLMSANMPHSSVHLLLQRGPIPNWSQSEPSPLPGSAKRCITSLINLPRNVAGVARTATVLLFVCRTAGFNAGTKPIMGKFSPIMFT